jgi:uncharacterized Fe-S cluster-containing radical SAM superfamily protein
MRGYDPIKRAERLRPKMIDPERKRVLLAVLTGTDQAGDLSSNRFWLGIFRSKIYTKPEETEKDFFRGEPAGVAAQKLTIPHEQIVTPQECNAAFLGQINGCNLNCWYCYVDPRSKSANPKYGKYFSAEEYLLYFLAESKRFQNSLNPNYKLNVLRLSGGEVFIVPEIIIWMIKAIKKFGLERYIYVWVDSNLSTGDFYWRYLNLKEREEIRNYQNIGFCVCYKGFDAQTFYKNTGAAPEFFDEQFKMHQRLVNEGLDVYSYLYPITSSTRNLKTRLATFMNRLQKEVDQYAPLRLATPPIKVYGPT